MGDGAPLLIFVPGLISDWTVWQPAADALAPYPVAFADVTRATSITGMAEEILTQHPGKLVVAGHSMGGRVALEMARLAADRIAGLALFNTGYHPRKEGEEAKRQHFIDLANQHGMEALLDEWLPPMVAPQRGSDAQLLNLLRGMAGGMNPQIHERQLRALLGRPDAWPHLSSVKCPVLVAVGRQDGWSPPAQHEEMAGELPNAKLVLVEDAGHFAPIEQPEATAMALKSWLATVKESA
jgi:pimeloyl-ACP methyl ester carboxylesterase